MEEKNFISNKKLIIFGGKKVGKTYFISKLGNINLEEDNKKSGSKIYLLKNISYFLIFN